MTRASPLELWWALLRMLDPRRGLMAATVWLILALATAFTIAASTWVGGLARVIVLQQHARRLQLETDQIGDDVSQAIAARLGALRVAEAMLASPVQGAVSAAFISDSIAKHSSRTEIGAHSIFLGQVRADLIGEKKVTSIEYTSYEEMALQKMHEIREEIFKTYQLTCMHVYHSLGKVNAGEICLFVFTSSRHRRMAIDACNEIVERIKSDLPVWGKEIFEDESQQWKTNN